MTEFILGCTIIGLIYFLPTKNPECSIAGFSPDITVKQKEMCRSKK
jgi:hypothetical protein